MAVGLALTVLVLVAAALYLGIKAGQTLAAGELAPDSPLQLLLRLPAAEIAQFAAGMAALLAFLWLVLATFQQNGQLRLQRHELTLQRREIAGQRRETERLAHEAHAQLELLRQTMTLTRRESFMRLLDLYERRLVQEASHISSITAIDPVASEDHKQAWIAYEQGDRDALFQNLIRQLVDGQYKEFLRRIDRVTDGRAFLQRYSATVSEVLAEAAAVDEQFLALCRASQWTYLSELLERVRAEA